MMAYFDPIAEDAARHMHRINELEEAEAQRNRDADVGCLLTMLAIGVPLYLVVSFVFSTVTAGIGSLGGFVSWLASESLLAPVFPAPGDGAARSALSIATLLLLLSGAPLYLSHLLRGTRLAVLRWALTPLGLVMVPVTAWACGSQMIAPIVRLAS
ncbi:hypothetical protein PWG71_16975 [Nocardiopsis sp. N85]|uniref:hypothetical protein n=1 Tax=Nocardiopsis sp. N85 TaxID=3029400 RepID=UPI00237F1B0E|nr:hypothetical protein [Nocardiopsis sp. N85]MDE3723086.1 hypothetical protein [Nocardiopsis sp. N85]